MTASHATMAASGAAAERTAADGTAAGGARQSLMGRPRTERMAADGFSYERRAIESWLGRGKRTSPKTNEELPHAFLVPNRHLKAMCQQFLDEVREVEEAGG